MAIHFPVTPRTIVLCDYSRGGFQPPEMVKRRPAVVLSPRLPHRDGLCTVIPLSGSAPEQDVDYVVRVELPHPLPAPFAETIWWAKCDMIATVSHDRLDLFRTGRDPNTGKRRYLTSLRVPETEFERICHGVLCGLGFTHLTPSP